MNILILSRGPELYSTRSLFFAGQKRGHQMRILDYMECNLTIEAGRPMVYFRGEPLEGIDAIIPRIGTSATFFGATVIRQFEMMGVFSLTPSAALLRSRDKLQCMQLLSNAAVAFPKTAYSILSFNARELIEQIGGVPLVIKLLNGTHGMGVILAHNYTTAESVIEAFYKTRDKIIVQEFIKESKGEDLRAFVVNGEVVASMKRKAKVGEFRSNLHRGGSAIHIKLDNQERQTALRATAAMGLHVAGVDMLQSARGPLLLEVNASPGLEGIENTTGVDIADGIVAFLERKVGERVK